MLVPVTILLPQEIANMLQRIDKPSSNQSSSTNKDSGKAFKITPVSTQAQLKKEIKRTAGRPNFTPRLLGGRTPSQLFHDIEEEQKAFCQVLPFELATVATPKAFQQTKKPAIRAQQQKIKYRKNQQVNTKVAFGRKNPVQEQKVQRQTKAITKQPQKKNSWATFVPRLFGKRTSSQLFFMSQFTRNEIIAPKQNLRVDSFVSRLFGKRTPSQLFFMNRFQEIRSAPDATQIRGSKQTATAKKNQFVPRLFGKRTSSQLFKISKILRRRAQLDYKPKSLKLVQRKATFAKSKKTKTASSQHRAAKNIPVYGTTGQHGYLTPSRLLNPYRIKRERYYTLGKGRKTPSELLLAYAREHNNRPSLFGALTGSQLLTVAKRQANRSQNDRQLDASSSLPTISQLGLNRRASKSKAKPAPQPSSKLLKHLNQLPMEKSKNIDDALKGLTSSQLFLVTDKKLVPQSKKSVQPQKSVNVYSTQKTARVKGVTEKSNLTPFLYGF
jgi:hypothetical protein